MSKYSLLQPVCMDIPHVNMGHIRFLNPTFEHVLWLIRRLGRLSDEKATVAIDVETRGTETWKPETRVIGVGFAWAGAEPGGCYFNTQAMSQADNWQLFRQVYQWALNHPGHLVNHNVYFDAAMWAMELGDNCSFLPYTHCTYGLYKQLAGEGFPGQRWGLKQATVDLLMWPEKHDIQVDNWLIENGHKKGKGADKSKMHLVPPEILGRYCIIDCHASLAIYTHVLRPVLDRFPELEEFHCGPWMDETRLLAAQRFTGIRIDRPRLEKHAESLKNQIHQTVTAIHSNPITGDLIHLWEYRSLRAKQAKHQTKRPPAELKSGAISKRYAAWGAKYEALTADNWNPASNQHLNWLLFDVEKGLIRITSQGKFTYTIVGKNGQVELEKTKSGGYAVGKDLISQLPDWGKPIGQFKKLTKELSYVTDYLSRLDDQDRLHPGWIMDGTKTLRLSGTGPNLQQLPKSLELMECFIPDEDTVWIEGDWTAIEPHVLCELSQDPGLLALYGPGAQPHDRYLYSAAHYPGQVGDAVRKHYNVENVTVDSVAAAKRACKDEREVGKLFVLAGDYGAGARKLHRSARVRGLDLTLAQASDIHAAHRKLHAGVYEVYGPALEAEWRRNGGWVRGGLGHPVCIWDKVLKDCVNRVVQSTAHKIHVLYVSRLSRLLQENRIPTTGIVWDFHDQFIIQVNKQHAEMALHLARESVRWINSHLQWSVYLKLSPRIVRSMGEAKMEEAHAKAYTLGSPNPSAKTDALTRESWSLGSGMVTVQTAPQCSDETVNSTGK